MASTETVKSTKVLLVERQQSINDSVGLSVVPEDMPQSKRAQLLVPATNADHGYSESAAHTNIPRRVAEVHN
jgi:hypothetical protein